MPQMKLSNKSVRMLTTNASHEKYKAYAKEAYGINLDVEVVALSDGLTKLVSYRLANKAPDVVSSGIQPAVYNAGYYQPLDGKINWNHKLWNDASLKAYNEQLKWKNHQYIVGTNRSIDGFIYYNTDMFDEAGLEYLLIFIRKINGLG